MDFGIIHIPVPILYLALFVFVFVYMMRRTKKIKHLRKENRRLGLELSIRQKRQAIKKLDEIEHKKEDKYLW